LAKFTAASRLTRSTFKITAMKQTYDFSVACRIFKISLLAYNDDSFCKTKLNGIFRVVLKAISWASGVEFNYIKKR